VERIIDGRAHPGASLADAPATAARPAAADAPAPPPASRIDAVRGPCARDTTPGEVAERLKALAC
jgi:hypothetical protein